MPSLIFFIVSNAMLSLLQPNDGGNGQIEIEQNRIPGEQTDFFFFVRPFSSFH